MLPSQLYQFASAKDSAGGRLEVGFTRLVFSGLAAVTVNSPIVRVPLDRVAWISNVQGAATAGAAQNALAVRIAVVDDLGNAFCGIAGATQAAGGSLQFDRQTDIWVPPGFGLKVTATFDAGAAVNFASIDVIGVMFPRANVQMGAFIIE